MSWRPKAAMVLAAGLGARMRPLTLDRPKPLLRVGGRALLDHMLDRLAEGGVERAVVNVHYLADQMEAHLAARTSAPAITISDERAQLLETGGALRKARALLGDEPIAVANTDSIWIGGAPALASLAAAWDPERMDALLLTVPLERSTGFDGDGDFFMGEDGRLVFRGERPAAPLAYMGLHITKPQIVDSEPDDAFSLAKIWRRLAEDGRLFGARFDGHWLHVGDPAAFEAAQRRFAGTVEAVA